MALSSLGSTAPWSSGPQGLDLGQTLTPHKLRLTASGGWGSGQMRKREELWKSCGSAPLSQPGGVWVAWGEWLLVGRDSILPVVV